MGLSPRTRVRVPRWMSFLFSKTIASVLKNRGKDIYDFLNIVFFVSEKSQLYRQLINFEEVGSLRKWQ